MTEKSTLQVLVEARALIEKPGNWLNRLPTTDDERSGRFCAARAVWCTTGESHPVGRAALDALAAQMPGGWWFVPDFNDSHTHGEVLAIFDKAIAAERAKDRDSRLGEQVKDIISDALTSAPACETVE